MALNSTATQRILWAPVCKTNVRQGVLDSWRGLDSCMRLYNYAPRKGVTGARSCRRITGGTGYSLHSYFVDGMFTFWNGLTIGLGIAVDINWDRNPYGKRLITDMPRNMVEAILAIRTVNGEEVWGWGGNYRNNKDAMHYELACSPADLATGINWSTVRGTVENTPQPQLNPPPGVVSDRKWPGDPCGAEHHGYCYEHYRDKFDGNVQYIQQRLNKTNLHPKIVEDGYYGGKTTAAVDGFQGAQHLGRDGICGPNTWNKLNEITD